LGARKLTWFVKLLGFHSSLDLMSMDVVSETDSVQRSGLTARCFGSLMFEHIALICM
jgi:hypothetical protein